MTRPRVLRQANEIDVRSIGAVCCSSRFDCTGVAPVKLSSLLERVRAKKVIRRMNPPPFFSDTPKSARMREE